MRTTLTLDNDVASLLKEIAYRTGESFKATVNDTLRLGLAARSAPQAPKAYRLEPVSLGGVVPGIDLNKALQLSDALEDEAIARKLEMRK
jgi:hypothetical protein